MSGSQTFTSPTGVDGLANTTSFSTNDADVFQSNGSFDGIDILESRSWMTIRGAVRVARDGVGHTNLPPYMALAATIWTTSGGTPGTSFVTQATDNHIVPAGAADDQWGSITAGYVLKFVHTASSLSAGDSYGLWLAVTNVAANWKYSQANLTIHSPGYSG